VGGSEDVVASLARVSGREAAVNAPTVESLAAKAGGDAIREALDLSVRWVARLARCTPEVVQKYERAIAAGAPVEHPKLDAIYRELARLWEVGQ
jgi:hypothetical protein